MSRELLWVFERNTGHSWCEENYVVHTAIAEFVNTVSSSLLILLPVVGLLQTRDYVFNRNRAFYWPYLMFLMVGISSAYYHATLSLFGQLFDEISILWLVLSGITVMVPAMTIYPTSWRNRTDDIRKALFLVGVMCTALEFVKPSVNAYALMLFAIPYAIIMIEESRRSGSDEAWDLTMRLLAYWTVGLGCWLADSLMCDVWLRLGIPYFHALWHIISAMSAHNIFVLAVFMDMRWRAPELLPTIRKVPNNSRFYLNYTYVVYKDLQHC